MEAEDGGEASGGRGVWYNLDLDLPRRSATAPAAAACLCQLQSPLPPACPSSSPAAHSAMSSFFGSSSSGAPAPGAPPSVSAEHTLSHSHRHGLSQAGLHRHLPPGDGPHKRAGAHERTSPPVCSYHPSPATQKCNEKCYAKCVTKPGSSLSGSEQVCPVPRISLSNTHTSMQTCLSHCLQRYMEACESLSSHRPTLASLNPLQSILLAERTSLASKKNASPILQHRFSP